MADPTILAQSSIPSSQRVRPLPLYAQVQKEIADAIISDRWEAGSLIPSEQVIAEEFGVSIGTVRRALGELVKNGYLERRPRHGTFVSVNRPHHDLRMFYDFFRLHTEDDRLVTSEFKDLSLKLRDATEAEAKALRLPEEDHRVAYLERVRFVGGSPVTYDQVLIPLYYMPDFPDQLPVPKLMYKFYRENFGLRITSVRERLAAVAATARDAEMIKVARGSPLLEMEVTARDQRHQIVEFRTCRATTNGYRYVNEVR